MVKRYKISPETLHMEGAPVFAYLRRSTKNKQEVSLENQADNIDLIIKGLKIPKNRVKYFEESHSAFENRQREVFERMLKEISQLKTPCILLVRDPSRLSRNPNDSLKITNLLFGDNGCKRTIAKIVFFEEPEWDCNTDKIKVTQTLLSNYHESITTGRRSKNGVNAKLARGEYVHRTPVGLTKERIMGVLYLKQTEKMMFVREAFKMKSKGSSHRNICAYLLSKGIKVSDRYLTELFFTNTIYIGEYTDKKTGEVFKNLKFFEGQPPVSMALWMAVQSSLGKKRDNYGDKQELFELNEKLRTEGGRRLSGYIKKGTKQYKNTTEGIHVSEKWIIDQFFTWLKDAISSRVAHDWSKKDTTGLESLKNAYKEAMGETLPHGPTEYVIENLNRAKRHYSNVNTIIKSIDQVFLDSTKDIRDEQSKKITELELEREKIEEQNNQAMSNFLKVSSIEGMEQVLQKELESGRRRIIVINEQIEELKNQKDFDLFRDKAINILKNIFELTGKVLDNQKNKELKEDVLQLIQLTAFELKVKKKKALEIELFGPLKKVLFGKDVDMEAPAGVEPASRALQAPVGPFYQGAVKSIKSEKLKKKNGKELLF